MSPSTNTCSGSIYNIAISTESTTIPTSPLPYLTQTDLGTIIKEVLASFNENIYKQDAKFEKQQATQDVKFEKQHATLVHIQKISHPRPSILNSY